MNIVPDPSLVWLVGPSGAGKTSWAMEHFREVEIVSSDHLRSVVGSGPADLEASAAAFDILERIARTRLERGLMTVIDTLGFDDGLRERLFDTATQANIETIAVIFNASAETCRTRNRLRDRRVPAKVLSGQFKRFAAVTAELRTSEWRILEAEEISVLSERQIAVAAESVAPTDRDRLEFHLQISTFDWMHSRDDLLDVVTAVEKAGFSGISVMDHLIQIPQVGRPWDDILDPFTTLAFTAAATERLRLGVLVANVTLRPAAVVAKMIATLDHLSDGRIDCGLGAGWFASEQTDRNVQFQPDAERLDLLEDTVGALRRFWGPGGRPFSGRTVQITDSAMYPRPLQETVPIIVGGGGERRTLRIVAEHADGCNLRTGPDIDHKVSVLAAHCADVGRDIEDVLITALDVTLTGSDREHAATLVERHRGNQSSRQFRDRTNAATADEQILRYGALQKSGIDRVYVSLIDLDGPEPVRRFGDVIAGLSDRASPFLVDRVEQPEGPGLE